MPTAPLIAAAFAANMVTCFAGEQDCAGRAISAIDAARHEILVNAYALTTGSGIPAVLIRAHNRNDDVRPVADRRAPCDLQEGVDALAAAAIPVWIDVRASMAREKALIIDQRPRSLLSREACGRSPRGQRRVCAREQPRGRVRHRRQLRGPPPPDLGLSPSRPAPRSRPGRSVRCRWEGRPQRGVWITRFGDHCGARIAKRNTSQDVRSVTSVMIRVPGID
jgi:hypothetical protein